MTTILAIEDEPAILENILETLEFGDFKGIGAPNGLIGVAMAREHLPDLVLCDIMMPELNGYDVLLQLRGDPTTASIPFIFLSAKAEREAQRQGMEYGADDFVTKPFTPAELLVAINTRLERRSTIVQEQEGKLQDLRGNLIHMLPHELRTPLTGILGYSDLILADIDTMDKHEIKEMVGHINFSGQRLLHLIENFLMFAQIEIVKLDPEREALMRSSVTANPKGILDAEAVVQAQQSNRTEDLVLDIAEVEAIQVGQDSLRKIVKELVDNAFKFSKPGQPVEISGSVIDEHFILSISDHGRGMTGQQIANFGAYMQFERKIYEQQGAGLGLTIAKQLTEMHGGHFSIESIPEVQTTVSAAFAVVNASDAAGDEY